MKKPVSAGVIIGAIVLTLLVVAYFGWRAMSVPTGNPHLEIPAHPKETAGMPPLPRPATPGAGKGMGK